MNAPREVYMKKTLSITEYLSRSVKRIAAGALRASIKNPRETSYILTFSTAARRAEKVRLQYEKAGHHIPAFLIASISSECNLHCTGCYARENQSCTDSSDGQILPAEKWNSIFSEARQLGVSFILLAGGEPLFRRDVIEYASSYPEIIFPVFTNGTMFSRDYLRLFDNHRNLVPVISIEGDRQKTDSRRGAGVFCQLTDAMTDLSDCGIFFGVSITVTTENIFSITQESFISDLSGRGCKVVFFIEYVPVISDTAYLAPKDPDRSYLEEKQNALRAHFPGLIFLSFPGDEKKTGGCLAAGRGFFHINPYGGAEPCPFSPYSDINVQDHSLLEVVESGFFGKLSGSGILTGEHAGGCLLFEESEKVAEFLKAQR